MSDLLSRASRNLATLQWWSACQPSFKLAARARYAAHLGCADCELGTDAEFAQDSDVILWLAATFPHTIASHQDDGV